MTRGRMPISTTLSGGLLRRQANDQVVGFVREIKFRRGHCAQSGNSAFAGHEKARELLAPGPSSIHADLLRQLQRR